MTKKATPVERSKLNESFAEILQYALIKKYKSIPAAAFIAKEFNNHTNHAYNMTSEGVRLWLQGKTIPEFERLVMLKDWLGIDLNGFGKCPDSEAVAETAASLQPGGLIPSDPHFDRIKQRHIYDFQELQNLLHETVDNYIRRLR